LAGNPGKRPLNQNEPEPQPGEPGMPPYLSAAAKAKWQQLTPILLGMGVLTVADGDALALYCETWANYVRSIRTLRSKKATPADREAARRERNNCFGVMEKMFARFGLTPADRSRIHVAPVKKEDPFEAKFLKAGRSTHASVN
jgi:P27 family predicted phage terminase small subunit